jgi:prepilin-type N-terminal cleavage/methylation domain-containing protein
MRLKQIRAFYQPIKHFLGSNFKHRQGGFSLVEMAIAMTLFVILGIATANLMMTTTLSQINDTIQSQCEHVASTVVDRLRWDLRFAQNVQVAGGGTTLTFTLPDNPGQLTYQFANNTLIRTDSAGRRIDFRTAFYNDPNHPLTIQCLGPCFNATALGPTTTAQVTLNNLLVRDNSPIGTALDSASNITETVRGADGQNYTVDYSRAQFRIEAATFNILTGQQFQ